MMKIIGLALLFLPLAIVASSAQKSKITISGVVTDEHTHQIVGGAEVSVVGNYANLTATDDYGVFSLSVPQGMDKVRIRVEKPGYNVREPLVPVSSSVPLSISLSRTVSAKKANSSATNKKP